MKELLLVLTVVCFMFVWVAGIVQIIFTLTPLHVPFSVVILLIGVWAVIVLVFGYLVGKLLTR